MALFAGGCLLLTRSFARYSLSHVTAVNARLLRMVDEMATKVMLASSPSRAEAVLDQARISAEASRRQREAASRTNQPDLDTSLSTFASTEFLNGESPELRGDLAAA